MVAKVYCHICGEPADDCCEHCGEPTCSDCFVEFSMQNQIDYNLCVSCGDFDPYERD
jgi:hypothetical protein